MIKFVVGVQIKYDDKFLSILQRNISSDYSRHLAEKWVNVVGMRT